VLVFVSVCRVVMVTRGGGIWCKGCCCCCWYQKLKLAVGIGVEEGGGDISGVGNEEEGHK